MPPPTPTLKKISAESLLPDLILDLAKPEGDDNPLEASEAQKVDKPGNSEEWLPNLNKHFIDKVVEGLEASLRDDVMNRIQGGEKLTPKQKKSVISSLNHEIFQFIGSQRLDKNLCR